MSKYCNKNLRLLNPKMMRNMHFCPKGPAICKISQQTVMKLGNSKQAVLFGVILPFKDITQIQKKVTIESCLRVVFEGVQSLVKLVQTMNKKIILENH